MTLYIILVYNIDIQYNTTTCQITGQYTIENIVREFLKNCIFSIILDKKLFEVFGLIVYVCIDNFFYS